MYEQNRHQKSKYIFAFRKYIFKMTKLLKVHMHMYTEYSLKQKITVHLHRYHKRYRFLSVQDYMSLSDFFLKYLHTSTI